MTGGFAHVRFLLPDASRVVASHGDLVGRLSSAAVHLNDPRVSEAHAMVSLRGQELKLLALRGRFALDGKPLTELALVPDQVIAIAGGVHLRVEDVVLPDRVLAIEAEGVPQQVLTGVCSILVGPRTRVVRRYEPQAAVRIWSVGSGWRVQIGDSEPEPLDAGDTIEVAGRVFRALSVPLARASQDATRLQGGIAEPITLVAKYDSVHILREGQPATAVHGIGARILSELVALGGPAEWELIAGEIWSDAPSRLALRRKWDVNLSRLRGKLRAARVRADLIRSDGSGRFELLLNPGDVLEDQT